jgi:hypothetical protein
MKIRKIVAMIAFPACLAGVALAQKPPVDDPTVPSPRVKELLPKIPTEAKASTKFPSITLKGRVLAKARPAQVVLEIDGAMFTAAKGVNILLNSQQILKVVDVTADAVTLQLDGSETFTVN